MCLYSFTYNLSVTLNQLSVDYMDVEDGIFIFVHVILSLYICHVYFFYEMISGIETRMVKQD